MAKIVLATFGSLGDMNPKFALELKARTQSCSRDRKGPLMVVTLVLG